MSDQFDRAPTRIVMTMTLLIASCVACFGDRHQQNSPPGLDSPSASPGQFAVSSSLAQGQAWRKFIAGLRGKWRGKTLKVMVWYDSAPTAWDRTIVDFERLTGADVQLTRYGYQQLYLQQTFLGNMRSRDYDIYEVDYPWVGRAAVGGYTEPLNPYLARTSKDLVDWNDQFMIMREGVLWGDAVTGMPYAPWFVINMYNRELMKKAKIDAPPRTYDQLLDAAARIRKKTGAYGVSTNNQTGTVIGQAFFEYIYNMGGRPFTSERPGAPNGDYYADMTPEFTSRESLSVIRLFKKLIAMQPERMADSEWTERYKFFSSGEAGFMSAWNDTTSKLPESKVAGKIGIQPILHKKGIKYNTPIGGWLLSINRHIPVVRKDLAWDFLVWFTSPQTGATFSSRGGFPARYSVVRHNPLIARFPYFELIRKVADTTFPAFRPQIPESFDIIETLGTWIAKAISGELPVKDAMARASRDIGDMLAEAGYKTRSPGQ